MQTSRRGWLAASGLLVAQACGRRRGAAYEGYGIIATSGDKALAVIDLARFRLVDSLALGAQPTAVLASDPANLIYALTPETGTVHVFDYSLRRRAAVKLADQLSFIQLSAARTELIAISAAGRQVIQAQASDLKVVRRHTIAAEPGNVDVAGDPLLVAVSSGRQGLVEIISLRDGRSWRTRLPGATGRLRFRADGKLLLVANLESRSLVALKVPTLETVAELPLAMKPENLCFNSDQGQLFVTGEGMDGVAIVFPYRVLEVDQTVLAGRDPGVMACSGQAPGYLFVGSNSGSDVCIVNIDNRKVVGVVDTAERPGFIAITPDSQYALILNESSGDMAVIHIPAIRANRAKSGASLFTMLPVGNRPVHAAVVPRVA